MDRMNAKLNGVWSGLDEEDECQVEWSLIWVGDRQER